MTTPRTDVAQALYDWINATHDRESSSSGDECYWAALCPETGQGLTHDLANCGLKHRRQPELVELLIEQDVVLQIRRYGAAIRYHAAPPPAHRVAFNIRPIGPVVVLRRTLDLTRDGSRGELHLDTAALLAAADAIEAAMATAPIGKHLGTRGGHRLACAAAGLAA